MITNSSLGLKEVKIIDFKEVNGKLEVVLEKETTSSTCPTCHKHSYDIKDYKFSKIIDKPIGICPGSTYRQKKTIFLP